MDSTPSSTLPFPAADRAVQETPARRAFRAYFKSRLAVFGLVLLMAIVTIALLAPLIAPQDPYDLMQLDIMNGRLEPGSKFLTGMTFLLGTDDQGRVLLSGIMYGLRISLGVG